MYISINIVVCRNNTKYSGITISTKGYFLPRVKLMLRELKKALELAFKLGLMSN